MEEETGDCGGTGLTDGGKGSFVLFFFSLKILCHPRKIRKPELTDSKKPAAVIGQPRLSTSVNK